MRIIYRGVYAGFPAAALHTGDLAYATDLLVLFISDGTNWVAYRDYPDYQGEKRGVYTPAEWAAFEGEDITIFGTDAPMDFGESVITTYTVPPGRTLYIVRYSASVRGFLEADNNRFLYIWFRLRDVTGAIVYVSIPANIGVGDNLAIPVVIPENHQLEMRTWNDGTDNCVLEHLVGGYEI